MSESVVNFLVGTVIVLGLVAGVVSCSIKQDQMEACIAAGGTPVWESNAGVPTSCWSADGSRIFP